MNAGTASSQVSVGDALNNARRLLLSHPDASARQAQMIIDAEPSLAEAHLILAAAFRLQNRDEDALEAEREGLRVAAADATLAQVNNLLSSGRDRDAKQLLQRFLEDTPNDPEALRLLASIAMRSGNLEQAERLIWRALALAPSYAAARQDFETLLERQALAEVDRSDKPPTPPGAPEEFEVAIAANEKALEQHFGNAKVWLSYGHVLRIAGRHDQSVAAYRRAVELDPGYGEAWWSLADLKTSTIAVDDRLTMAGQLERQIGRDDRIGIHFALGKAFEDEARHEEAFRCYAEGNSLKRKAVRYDVTHTVAHVRQCQKGFTTEFFERRRDPGHDAPDPIFIVGMPRSGSTLVEQILASHPAIEGTEELVYFGNLSSFIAGGRKAGLDESAFVPEVASLTPDRLQVIGGAYLWNASRRRLSSRPHFTDKMPRNWLYLPLIRLALPNAKIIDVRRNAMDCCWSNFRQLFADSGEYSYDLTELGQYYRAYVEMLDHFELVDPGAVHRLRYEQLIADPQDEIRQVLEYLELPFDTACLEFHRNPRAVKTASSEQVRRPINRAGLGQWLPYEKWLGPLKAALGPLADE